MTASPVLRLDAAQQAAVAAAAVAAYPGEACGLLVGRPDGDGGVTVTRVVESANLRGAERADRFEVDPAVRARLHRDLRADPAAAAPDGPRLIGHYHSHPDGSAEPSEEDRANAGWEPALLWLIVSVATDGEAGPPRAWRFDPGAGVFTELGVEKFLA